MTDMTVTRPGQINGSGASDALFLKLFAGETLTAFAEANRSLDKHVIRTISGGKSAQFPASWKGSARYHTPGTLITGTTVNFNERVIGIDGKLIADRFVADIDEAMAQWDYRQELARDAGLQLAYAFDKHVLQTMGLAARASATVTGGNGGSKVTSASSKTNADALVQAIFDAATALDQKDVPDNDRFCFVTPAQAHLLVNGSSKAIDVRFNGNGSNGSIASGEIGEVAGVKIVKTNHLPQTNITTDLSQYNGDFSTTSALVVQRGAVGTVKLMELSVQMEYKIEYQGTILVASYAMGHGILRPECAVEIATA